MKVGLVACVAQKAPTLTRAGDLYQSQLFLKSKQYVLRNTDRWFILSAEHGLLDPATIIAPYEKTLNNMSVRDRTLWAAGVCRSLGEVLEKRDELTILAGSKYRDGIVEWLERRSHKVYIPLEGLRIGEQLAWLTNAVG